MEIRQLKYFVRIVELGSVSRAAADLFIAQPALSHQISNLEEELKVKLLSRSVRGVSATEAGEVFYRHARAMLRQMGKTAGILYNRETTEHFESYVEQYWVADDFDYETVVSVDLAALSLFPDNAEMFKTRVDLAIDHHPSYEGFGKESCVHPECAACGEILCELAQELGQLTPEVALPLYVAVSTDTGCFVYSNVTANTHRVAAALMETGIDYKAANKLHFRTKSKKRLALEGELLRTMEFYDEDRVVIVAVPQSLQKSMALSEADMEDLASLGGLVEGTDCAVTMKETKDGAWKVSVRTGARVNATLACSFLGGGGRSPVRFPRSPPGRAHQLPVQRRAGGDTGRVTDAAAKATAWPHGKAQADPVFSLHL